MDGSPLTGEKNTAEKEPENSGTMRDLLALLSPHRRVLVIGLLLGLVANAAGLATPLVTREILDGLAVQGSIAGPVAFLGALVVGGAVIGLLQILVFGRLGERIVLQIRRRVIDTVVRARVQDVVATPPGEVVSRVTSDPGLLQTAGSSAVGLVNGSITLIGSLVLMGVLDLLLLGTTLVAVVVVGALMALLLPRIGVAERQAQEHVGRLGATVESLVRGVRTVKAGRAEHRMAQRVEVDAGAAAEYGYRSLRTGGIAWTISWGGIQIAIMIILGLGAWRVAEGEMGVSTLVAFLLYAFALTGPISEVVGSLTDLQSGVAALGRLQDLDRLQPEAGPEGAAGAGPGDRAVGADTPVLELRGVHARYSPSGPEVLDGVDLAVPRRGHVALVGPSGAGKTTILSVVLRFLEPERGQVLLDGVPYADLGTDAIRARLTYVEQETPLLPGTLRDNLTLIHPDADEAEIERALEAVRLTEMVAGLPDGLDTEVQAGELSGGQRQRLALARALLRRPDVLLLDEATAQVDGRTEQALHDAVEEVARHCAVLTIAHRISTIMDADRIVVLEEGRVRAQGAHGELLTRDALYAELVTALRIEGAAGPVASGT